MAEGRVDEAKGSFLVEYPGATPPKPRKSWTLWKLVLVFARGRYPDRYCGGRLIVPRTLRALSIQLPDAFPYHPNWKQSVAHRAFWELSPTIDGIPPVLRTLR